MPSGSPTRVASEPTVEARIEEGLSDRLRPGADAGEVEAGRSYLLDRTDAAVPRKKKAAEADAAAQAAASMGDTTTAATGGPAGPPPGIGADGMMAGVARAPVPMRTQEGLTCR